MKTLDDRVSELEARVARLEAGSQAAALQAQPQELDGADRRRLPPPTIGYGNQAPSKWARFYRAGHKEAPGAAKPGAEPPKVWSDEEQEKWITHKALPFGGALLLVIAVFLGVQYLAGKGFLSPLLIFTAEAGASLLVAAAGLWMQQADRGHKGYPLIIQGVGAASLIISLVAGAWVQKAYPAAWCWPLCLAASGAALFWGAVNSHRGLAWTGIAGGLFAAWLAPEGASQWLTFAVAAASAGSFMVRRWTRDAAWIGAVAAVFLGLRHMDASSGEVIFRSIAERLTVSASLLAYLWSWKEGRDEYDQTGFYPVAAGAMILAFGWPHGWSQAIILASFGAALSCAALFPRLRRAGFVTACAGAALALLIAPWGIPGAPWPNQVAGAPLTQGVLASDAARNAIFLIVGLAGAGMMFFSRRMGWAILAFLAALSLVVSALPEALTPLTGGSFVQLASLDPRHLRLALPFVLSALIGLLMIQAAIGQMNGRLVHPFATLLVAAGIWAASATAWDGGDCILWISASFAASLGLLLWGERTKEDWLAWSGWAFLCGALASEPFNDDRVGTFAVPVWLRLFFLALAVAAPYVLHAVRDARTRPWTQLALGLTGLAAFARGFALLMPGQTGFSLTLAFSLFAVLLLYGGMRLDLIAHRWLSYLILSLAAVKALFVDSARLEPGPRALAFLAIGGACLAAGGIAVYLWRSLPKRGAPPSPSSDSAAMTDLKG